ncbi:Pleckstrin homology domain [Babesia duncani]|uniref:Pleckstrin homology domain n=1 Tax=Babesia duncani TaxID=323732 RepID=A0AAD9PI24_9APIC|nr:Pleckstrin homology domain [Babesia duncani]
MTKDAIFVPTKGGNFPEMSLSKDKLQDGQKQLVGVHSSGEMKVRSIVAFINEQISKNHKILDELKEEGARLLAWSYDLKKRKDCDVLLNTQSEPERDPVRDALLHAFDYQDPIKKKEKEKLIAEKSKGLETEKLIGSGPNVAPGVLVYPDVDTTDIVTPVRHMVPKYKIPLDVEINESNGHADFMVEARDDNYREVLCALQQKYAIILRKFDEVNEQRMSYMEGMDEIQAHLDNSRAVIQLQRHELVASKEKAIELEHKQEHAVAEIKQLKNTLHDVSNRERFYSESLDKANSQLHELNSNLTHATLQISDLQQQIVELGYMPKLPGTIETEEPIVRYTFSEAVDDLHKFHAMLKAAPLENTSVEGVDEWLKNTMSELPALSHLEALYDVAVTKDAAMIIYNRLSRSEARIQDYKDSFEKQRELDESRSRQIIESYAARIHQSNAECFKLKSMLTSLHQNLALTVNRDLPDKHTIGKIMAKCKNPAVFGMYVKPFWGKGRFKKCVLMMDKGIIYMGKANSSGEYFKVKSTVPISDLTRVNYGYHSHSWTLYAAASGKNKTNLFPWQFFTIYTVKREFHLLCASEAVLESWILSLNYQTSDRCFGQSVTDTGALRLLRAKMKLFHYTKKRGISHRKMWLEAIKKTLESQKT